MFNHEIFAVAIGRALTLLRAVPPDPAQQIAALETVHVLTSLASAAVRVYDGTLSIDDVGIADDLPAVPELVRRMQEHGLAEITIARGAPPADLVALLRALAADPEQLHEAGTVKRRLGKAAAASIVVLPLKALESLSGRRTASVAEALATALQEEGAAKRPDTGAAAPAAPTPAAAAQTGRVSEFPGVDWLALTGIPPDTPLGAALQAVTLDPYGENVLANLSALGRAIDKAFRSGEIEVAAQAIAAVVGLEPGAPEGSPRASYAITVKRALTWDVLQELARRAPDLQLAPIVTAVLHRGGADAVEILLGRLSAAETIRERKAFMTVLRGMRSGTEGLVAKLYHGEWFVVRNVVELVGELRLEEAVPRLCELLGHEDGRVRRSAAVALAKVGSVAAVEPLRRVLLDGTPELRGFVATSISGPHARPLAMLLVALSGEETDPAVLAEYYRALGRIGTPEAVQALAQAAQPSGGLLRRRPPAGRVAAIEALGQAGGAPALRALEALKKDRDKTVRAAAEKALGAAPK